MMIDQVTYHVKDNWEKLTFHQDLSKCQFIKVAIRNATQQKLLLCMSLITFWKQLANCITVSIRRLMTGHEVNRVVSLGDLFYSLKFWSWKFIKPRFKVGCRSTFAGAMLPSDVIDFAMLSAQRFWQETVLLFAVMWPGSNQRERAQYVGKKFPAKVKPLLSGHLRDLPKCSLNRGLYKMRNVC